VKTILHLSPDGDQYWQKAKGQWLNVEPPGRGSICVVTDMAEETLTDIPVPRLYGSDRAKFITRQLLSRFPETPYKTALPTGTQSGLLDRLAPLRQTLLAIEAKERIDQALDKVNAELVGIWSTSGLLARLGSTSAFPKNFFMVVPGKQSIRILFLKNRVPIISRLIREGGNGQLVAVEIIRTLRHLENTKVIERGGEQPPVLVLGNSEGVGKGLADERLQFIEAPKAHQQAVTSDFKFALFDLAMQSPPGQLAPLSRRTAHVATSLSRWAFAIAAGAAVLALWPLIGSYTSVRDDRALMVRSQATLADLSRKLRTTENAIAAYPVASELIKAALRIERDELRGAPAMPEQLGWISTALGVDPSLRLTKMEWSIETPGAVLCQKEPLTSAMPAPAAPPTLAASEAGLALPGSQIRFDVLLPAGLTGKARVNLSAAVSDKLAKIPGVDLQQNPAIVPADSSLAGGSKPVDASSGPATWCLVVSNSTPASPVAPSKP